MTFPRTSTDGHMIVDGAYVDDDVSDEVGAFLLNATQNSLWDADDAARTGTTWRCGLCKATYEVADRKRCGCRDAGLAMAA